MRTSIFLCLYVWVTGCCLGGEPLRVGLIGLDTSHVTAFTRLLNEEDHADHVPGARVVAAFRGGSPDIESSAGRVEGFTAELRDKYGVEIVGSIEELCRRVDVVMLESVDGRPHLHQAIPVIQAGKPLFIDKPMAGSLGDVLSIFRLAGERGVPVFSSSSLRYGGATQAVRRGSVGRVLRAETHSPCSLEPHHPDLFWYGIHGVESLFTVMGTGCERVRRVDGEGGVVVEGEWSGGRVGRFREGEGYGGWVVGEDGELEVGAYEGYRPLLVEVVKFFETGVAPVGEGETVEMFAFMEAADESKRRGGEAVSLAEVYGRYGYGVVPRVRLLRSRKIWDGAPHNAFTDLVRHGGRFYCVFREGEGHVSPGGAVRVLASEDGE
ncbi:MAG: Gfo/Idh/MocA family protein, partial [Limisphaerales bacterium]